MPTSIRQASPLDLSWFSTVGSRSPRPWEEEVEQWVREEAWSWYRTPDRDRHLVVADDQGDVIGVAGFEQVEPGLWFLATICVHHGSRREGQGRALLEYVLDHTLLQPADSIYWRVHEGNEMAVTISAQSRRVAQSIVRRSYIEFWLPATAA